MKRFIAVVIIGGLLLAGLPAHAADPGADESPAPAAKTTAVATFAGGCFWCMEAAFDGIDGIVETTSGYTGGHAENPTYEQVSSGMTGHAEAVRVTYDPSRIGYAQLLALFWRNVDPITPDAQFCDHGSQYRSAIFYHDEEQHRLAEASKAELDASKKFEKPIATEIVAAGPFHPAEEYHQDYHRKNPLRYRYYRYGCGRDARLEELWGKEAGGAAAKH